MTLDTKCAVSISSLDELECVPPSETPTTEPNTDPSESSATDNTAAIIGGVVSL